MKKLVCVLLALVMVLAMAACGSKSEAPATQAAEKTGNAETTAAAAPADESGIVRGGTLKVGKGILLSTLDPTKVTARDSDYDVICQIYEPLVRADANGNPVSGLAESWDVVDDTTIVFHLRTDVKFHDGTEFNADAVKANFDYYMDEAVGAIFATELKCVESVEVVDAATVQVNLNQPSSTFIMDLTNYSGLMIAPSALSQGAEHLASNACGTGPFKVAEYVEGVSIALEANPDYYRSGEDGKPLPYLDRVEISMIADQTTKVNSLLAGDIQLTDYLTTTGIEQLETNSDFTLQRIATSDIYTLFCQIDDKVLSDQKVRQALAYAVDREALANVITRGYGFASNWACDPDQWFYSDYTPYSYDVEKAKSLLAEAGFSDGVKLTMQCISREPDNTVMQVLQQQLAAAGITLVLESMERTEWVSVWTTEHTGQLGLAKMTVPRVDAYVQLNTNMGATSANNYSTYKGEEFNTLLQSLSGIYDANEQKEVLHKAQEVYLNDCASIFLYQMPRYDAYASSVQNFTTLALGPWDLSQIWLAN